MSGEMIASVLVTGTSRGIGLELVKTFLKKSNPPEHIFATCRNPAGAQELINLAKKHSNLHVIPLDITNQESIKAAYTEVKEILKGCGLTMVINNAAFTYGMSTEMPSGDQMMMTFKTNTVGPLIVTQEFIPLLKKAALESPKDKMSCSKASVINVTSVLGSLSLIPELFYTFPVIPYHCSKAALNMLTRIQAVTYKDDGILFVAVHPGWVQTDMGGPKAPLSKQECADSIMSLFAELSEEQNGSFLNWEGQIIPW